MVKVFYVYILQSQLDLAAILYRHTDNLRNRFQAHNNGGRLTQRNGTLALKNIY